MSLQDSNFQGKVTEIKEANVTIRGTARTFAEERVSAGSRKGPSNTKYVVGSISNVVFLLACYEYGHGWPWDDVVQFAEIQAEKINSALMT